MTKTNRSRNLVKKVEPVEPEPIEYVDEPDEDFAADIVVDNDLIRELPLSKKLHNNERFTVYGRHAGEGNDKFMKLYLDHFGNRPVDVNEDAEAAKKTRDLVIRVYTESCLTGWNHPTLKFTPTNAKRLLDKLSDIDLKRIMMFFTNPDIFTKEVACTRKVAKKKQRN